MRNTSKGRKYAMESECTIGDDEQQAEANSDRPPTDSSQPSDDTRALEQLVTSSATASLRIATNEDAVAATAPVAIAATSSSTGAPVASVARTRSTPIGQQNVLPWGDRLRTAPVSGDTPPGEFVLRAMCTEFAIMAGKKIDKVALEPLDQPISKYLQKGEDARFDQLLSSLAAISEHCLPSVLRLLIDWHIKQNSKHAAEKLHAHGAHVLGHQRTGSAGVEPSKMTAREIRDLEKEKDHLIDRRELAVDFIFCLAMINVLEKLSVHPCPETLLNYIEDMAFKRFRQRDKFHLGPNALNGHRIADLFAEVIGVLSRARFDSVNRKFLAEMQQPQSNLSTINVIRGMSFIRVKMYPVEELEDWFNFLKECGGIFIETKDKDIKHALASMFVEILSPVAAVVKREVNLPVVKSFVEMMYHYVIELAKRGKHIIPLYPLVTVLLCVSQKPFFLANWHFFLTMCLSNLKQKDGHLQRVALESLYRLLWVYMIRIKCEPHGTTQTRLRTIVDCLFPRGSRSVVPKDTPLNIFVKIIHFIAKEKLDFAMQEIIFELLGINSKMKTGLNPERMNIGLRAFLVIADHLETRKEDPPMPSTIGILPSGGTLRRKIQFTNKMLTDKMARKIGIMDYHQHVRRALESIVHALDLQVGRQLLMTSVVSSMKGPEEVFCGDRKPKIELYRTCIAAIPRIIPDGLSKEELVEHLSRLTVHLDNELRALAFTALQTLIRDFSSWRQDVIEGFVAFILKDIPDTCPLIIDSTLRILVHFMTQWKLTVQAERAKAERGEGAFPDVSSLRVPSERHPYATVLHRVEGLALVTLCSCRPVTRKLSIALLKEVNNLCSVLGHTQDADEDIVMDVIDRAGPSVIKHWFSALPPQERAKMQQMSTVDMMWLADQPSVVPRADSMESQLGSAGHVVDIDPWSTCLAGTLEMKYLPTCCPSALRCSWPAIFQRMIAAYSLIDPGFNVSDPSSRGSVRAKKIVNTRDLCLWRNYLVFACCIAPSPNPFGGRESPGPPMEVTVAEKVDTKAEKTFSAQELFHWLVPLVRSESSEIREAVVTALGKTNPLVFRELIEELQVLIKDALDRRTESTRKRRKRDALRVYLARIFELTADHGSFRDSPSGVVDSHKALLPVFVEYLEGTKTYLVAESDKDTPVLQLLRLHFGRFVTQMVNSIPPIDVDRSRHHYQQQRRAQLLSASLRQDLFFLFSGWCGVFALTLSGLEKKATRLVRSDELQLSSLRAMSAVLCAGPVFDVEALEQNGCLYGWIDSLLDCGDEKVHHLGCKTVEYLLVNNESLPYLLSWVTDRCFTGSRLVQDGAFSALAKVFNKREYPCQMIPLLNLVLYKTSDPVVQIREKATQLLQILDRRFFHSKSGGGSSALSGCFTATCFQSQFVLSQELARTHPELTLLMFSEMCRRFDVAPRIGQRCMLQYIVPWIENVEFVDFNWRESVVSPTQSACASMRVDLSDERRGGNSTSGLTGSGWGSAEGTQLVLNNLFYITAKFGDQDFVKEVECLWASLCGWEFNIRATINFLIYLAGQGGNQSLLSHATKVIVYLGRAQPRAVVEELVEEMKSVELLSAVIDEIAERPYYRITRVASSLSQSHENSQASHDLHSVKRRAHQAKAYGAVVERHVEERHSAAASRREPTRSPRSPNATSEQEIVRSWIVAMQTAEGNPVPLPAPPDNGYYCPLVKLLPVSSTPTPLHRCNFSLMLLTELVVERVDINWAVHLPLLLHVIFLGLDHVHSLVYEHCKRLLINLVLVLTCKVETRHDIAAATQAATLRSPSDSSLNDQQRAPAFAPSVDVRSDRGTPGFPVYGNLTRSESFGDDGASASESANQTGGGGFVRILTEEEEIELQARSLIDFITSRDRNKPLWQYEEITTRTVSIKSTAHLEALLGRVLNVFSTIPGSDIRRRWAKVALQWATSCSSRHYAGRSFQICRALRLPLSWSMLVDIVSRLVDFVGDPSPDVQGYVMEILLTLAAAVDNGVGEIKWLDDGFSDVDNDDDLHATTAATASHEYDGTAGAYLRIRRVSRTQRESSMPIRTTAQHFPTRKLTGGSGGGGGGDFLNPSDVPPMKRSASTSFEPFVATSSSSTTSKGDVVVERKRPFSLVAAARAGTKGGALLSSSFDGGGGGGAESDPELAAAFRSSSFTKEPSVDAAIASASRRVGSNHSPSPHGVASAAVVVGGKQQGAGTRRVPSPGEFRELLSRLFWVASAVLTSDYEHEFLMAVRLMNKVLDVLLMEDSDELERMLPDLEWNGFTGVQCQLMKGLTSTSTAESTVQLLARITPVANSPVFTATSGATGLGFYVNVACLVLHLGSRFDNRDSFCNRVASLIENLCSSDSSLPHLEKLFQLYREGNYQKSSTTWMTSIWRYLKDSYDFVVFIIPFLTEVLDYGPSEYQKPVLSLLSELADLRFIPNQTARHLNTLLQRVVSQFIKGELWGESLKLLQQVVSSSAQIPPSSSSSSTTPIDVTSSPTIVQGFFSGGGSGKKELLPGPTLDVMIDVSRAGYVRDEKGAALTDTGVVDLTPPWKKPQSSQRRTREKLVSVLKTCGQHEGFPSSASVVFSDDLNPEHYSSSETSSLVANNDDVSAGTTTKEQSPEVATEDAEDGEQIIGVMTEFDFLDDEVEDKELPEPGNPWGVRLRRRSDDSVDRFDVEVTATTATSAAAAGTTTAEQRLSNKKTSVEKVIEFEDEDRPSLEATTPIRIDKNRLSIDERKSDRLASVGSEEGGQNQPTLSSEYVPVASEEAEVMWRAHVATVINDNTGAAAVNTFHLFTQLIKATKRRVTKLTKDACCFLAENWGSVTSQFMAMIELLNTHVECPFVYVDTQFITGSHLLDQHKFFVMDIHENFSTYLQQRDTVMEFLEGIKMSLRKLSLVSGVESPSLHTSHAQEILLCRSLYKLHFQLVTLLTGYRNLLALITTAKRDAQVLDLSADLTEVEGFLRSAISSCEWMPATGATGGGPSSSNASTPTSAAPATAFGADSLFAGGGGDPFTLTRQAALQSLEEHIKHNECVQAVKLLRMFRRKWKDGMFGLLDEDDLDVLLFVYARYKAKGRSGIVIVTETRRNLATACSKLMEKIMHILTSLKQLDQ